MSEMHEVTTVIRRQNTEFPHPQRLPNGLQSTQSIGADGANDKNNNQEKSHKNVLKTVQVPSTPYKSKSNGIDIVNDNNHRDNDGGIAMISQRIGAVVQSLPKTNRSTLNTIHNKGHSAIYEDGDTARATVDAINDNKTNCGAEPTHSRISNECHYGKSPRISLP